MRDREMGYKEWRDEGGRAQGYRGSEKYRLKEKEEG